MLERWKRLIGLLLFGILLITMLTGCTTATTRNADENTDNAEESVFEFVPISEDSPDIQVENNSNNRGLLLERACEFSDGLAWVLPKGETWRVIDVTGKTVLVLNEEISAMINNRYEQTTEYPKSFSGGVSILNERTLINTKGEIVAQAQDGMFDSIITKVYMPQLKNGGTIGGDLGLASIPRGELNSNPIVDGAIFVRKQIDTYSLTEARVGIIGTDGQWLYEPDARLSNFTRMGEWVEYIGNGWYAGDTNYEDTLFNIHTKKFYQLGDFRGDNISFINAQNNDLIAYTDPSYGENFVFFFKYLPETDSFLMSKLTDRRVYIKKLGFFGSGLFYIELDVINSDDVISGFYNINGEQVLSMTEFDLIRPPYFVDGYAILYVRNHAKIPYFTVIDTAGTMMFEPVKLEGVVHEIQSVSIEDYDYSSESGDTVDFIAADGNVMTVRKNYNNEFVYANADKIVLSNGYTDADEYECFYIYEDGSRLIIH